MTAVAILAFGTRGDVAPLTGLAQALTGDGLDVTLAAQAPYRGMIEAAGARFALLPKDTENETRDWPAAQALVDGGRATPSRAMLARMRDGLRGVGEAMAEAAEGADAILYQGPVGAVLGSHVAEAAGIPGAGVNFQPLHPTGDFSPPPLGTRSYGRVGNRIAWRAAGSADRVYRPVVSELRRNLGLPSEVTADPRESPCLYAFDEAVVPRPADWPGNAEVTGYLWPAVDPGWAPDARLVDFLADGPVVYVGIGSTATAHGDSLSRIVIDAAEQAGVRVVLQRGWARLNGGSAPHVLTVGDVPHEWLLPRVTAAVHHCGAGTSAAAVRAGIPTVPVPGIMDQPFWADRLHRLGVATAPLPRHTITVGGLTAALESVLADQQMRRAAVDLGVRVAATDGITAAAGFVTRLLGRPESPIETRRIL
ncbi:glycosyltransferase [Tsukamurella sp. 8F]|uniref:glycosyltransferase n=1 Tax=unclassified Tsukamurella TaxID=2633480 RepID=UPI0023B89B05|nr:MULTISPECIES: glycosyltransferase [unclassified Tsukamurella]MDF0532306.1 glycosyltransferase [Tsukamurella sp. 8J]MDF0588991.1 glycosyltransferase [Tsukamurella sp. 8F]